MKNQNWTQVSFGLLCESIRPGFASGKHNSDGKGIPHLRPMNVDRNGDINLELIKYVQDEGHEPLKAGDILFNNTNSRELVGKTGLIQTDTNFAFSNHMTRIRLRKDLSSPKFYSIYLHYLFQRGYFKEHCSNHVNQSSIGTTFLEKGIEAPFPPLAEQHRIVAKIEELFSDLDAGIASLEKAKVQMRTYRYSVLTNGTNGNLTENDANTTVRIKYVKLGEKIERPQYGTAKKCGLEVTPWPVLRIPNIGPIQVDKSDLKYATFDKDEIESLKLELGDLLIIRSNGSPSIVGKCSVIRNSELNCLYAGYLIRIRPRQKELDSKFLYYVLNSPKLRQQIEAAAKSTSGVNNINSGEICSLLIPDLPLIDQVKFASEIESRLSEADNLEKTLDAALAQAKSLRQSILKQAFEGKLVPQDPNDEPAEKLLERIRAERAANAEAPRKRGRYGGGVVPAKAGGSGTPVEGGAPKPRRGRPPGKKATAAVKAKRRG